MAIDLYLVCVAVQTCWKYVQRVYLYYSGASASSTQALDIVVDMCPDEVARCIDEVGVGFMYAPTYHPAMKAVVPVRKALKVRTAFNMLGPLLNPAGASYGLIGVYSTAISPLMADALKVNSKQYTPIAMIGWLTD